MKPLRLNRSVWVIGVLAVAGSFVSCKRAEQPTEEAVPPGEMMEAPETSTGVPGGIMESTPPAPSGKP
ncbi:MAG: hypothetical protein HY548_08630 [Elusimicrobia bacterium]|nr:hypothetical protein [Elusimicrobiota bacterium]